MGDRSEIQWTDATWNPVTGCSKVSPGCAHCYAETLSHRYGWSEKPWTPGNAPLNVRLMPGRLDQPLRWQRPRMIFVNSMSDLFHELVPDAYIVEVFAVMALATRHTFQVLTKRPERMRDLLRQRAFAEAVQTAVRVTSGRPYDRARAAFTGTQYPLPNVWLGTSIENRRFVDRADLLRETPAAVRFISAEPLLGPLVPDAVFNDGPGWSAPNLGEFDGPGLDLSAIDWLIVGGESGPGHRRIEEEWVRALRDACMSGGPTCARCQGSGDEPPRPQENTLGRLCGRCGGNGRTGTAFFFKQWGGPTPKSGGRELDGCTWDAMPSVASATVNGVT